MLCQLLLYNKVNQLYVYIYPHIPSLFFFLTSLLEYNCFTVVCQFLLYNKVNQLYIYIYPHIPSLLRLPLTLPIPPLQVVTEHGADLPVLCGCFPLASYFTFGSVRYYLICFHFKQKHFCNLPPKLIRLFEYWKWERKVTLLQGIKLSQEVETVFLVSETNGK